MFTRLLLSSGHLFPCCSAFQVPCHNILCWTNYTTTVLYSALYSHLAAPDVCDELETNHSIMIKIQLCVKFR
jgi:hypothetical protein